MRKPIRMLVIPVTAALAALLVSLVLDPLWLDLAWRKPVADALCQVGWPKLAAYWALVWINLPLWGMAVICGAAIGLAFHRGKWVVPALIAGLTLLLVPHLLTTVSLGYHPWVPFGLSVAFQALLWELVLIPLLLLAAWLMSRFGRPAQKQAGSSPEPAQPASV